MNEGVFILGAGATGLGAGYVSGAPILESADAPGGICASYYVGYDGIRRASRNGNEELFRFERGGGHWIFGGDPEVRKVFESFQRCKEYERNSSVYLPKFQHYVPYPMQGNTELLPRELRVLLDQECPAPENQPNVTMDDWLLRTFGNTMYSAFFRPFHELYTAGLYKYIAPQDSFKSPQKNESRQLQPGYNAKFIYPEEGLGALFLSIAASCDVRYGKGVVRIDPEKRMLHLRDGESLRYSTLLNSLPLNETLRMAKLDPGSVCDPWTSVLVVNAAATRGPNCPDEHWVYVPENKPGFHRVGFYDNVEPGFLPASERGKPRITGMYIEKAYPSGTILTEQDISDVSYAMLHQLREWGYIEQVLIVDPTIIPVAYTWQMPGSTWREDAIELLERHGITQIGRYGRWQFQGISASFKEGMNAAKQIMNERTLTQKKPGEMQGNDQSA